MPELLKKPCSCGGNNPNCYMCGGWGYIDSVSESRTPTGQGELAKSTTKEIPQKVKFKRLVIQSKKTSSPKPEGKVNKKAKKRDDDNLSKYFINNEKPEKINPRECLFCGYPILKRDIESHIKRYHRNNTKDKKEKIRIALNLLFTMLD